VSGAARCKPNHTYAWWEWLFSITGTAAIVVAAVVGFYWVVIDTHPPISQIGEETIIRDASGNRRDRFKVGEAMVVEQTFCRDYLPDTPGTVRVTWENSIIFTTPPFLTRRDLGCRTRSYWTVVPDIPSDVYAYKVAIEWRLNPLTSVAVAFPPATITVIP